MSCGYVLTRLAAHDVDEIVMRIAETNPDTAIKIHGRFLVAFEKIASAPMLGHGREDLVPSAYRVRTVYNWLVIYKASVKPVIIARVLHGARDVRSEFRPS